MKSSGEHKIVVGGEFVQAVILKGAVVYESARLVDDYKRKDGPVP